MSFPLHLQTECINAASCLPDRSVQLQCCFLSRGEETKAETPVNEMHNGQSFTADLLVAPRDLTEHRSLVPRFPLIQTEQMASSHEPVHRNSLCRRGCTFLHWWQLRTAVILTLFAGAVNNLTSSGKSMRSACADEHCQTPVSSVCTVFAGSKSQKPLLHPLYLRRGRTHGHAFYIRVRNQLFGQMQLQTKAMASASTHPAAPLGPLQQEQWTLDLGSSRISHSRHKSMSHLWSTQTPPLLCMPQFPWPEWSGNNTRRLSFTEGSRQKL